MRVPSFNKAAEVGSASTATEAIMAKMRAVQVPFAGGPFEIVEREIPEPASGEVRVKIQACGICHSDEVTKAGNVSRHPRTPACARSRGHWAHRRSGPKRSPVEGRSACRESAGTEATADTVTVAAAETSLLARRRLWPPASPPTAATPTIWSPPYTTLAEIPEELSAEEAAPLMCAGVTTFNCLRNSGARPGDVVAVIGLGGLGHLGIQFAAKSGFQHRRHRPWK